MRFCSYIVDGEHRFGVATDNGIVDLSKRIGSRFPTLREALRHGGLEACGAMAAGAEPDYSPEKVEFLPLFSESVVIHCIGLNYADHAAEAQMKVPKYPRSFTKQRASLVGHDMPFEMPTASDQFDFEGELAVVINKTCRNVREEDAHKYIAGYTCFMDGSVRDYQFERTLEQGKNFFHSSSMGPYLVTPDEVGPLPELAIQTIVSGERMQRSTFSKMMFSVPALIAYITHFTELNAGDVIATGTPEGVGFKRTPPRFLKRGDRVEVIIDKVGHLINEVR